MEVEPPSAPARSSDREFTHRALFVIGAWVSIVVLVILVWYLAQVLLLVFAGILLAIILRTPADWLARHTRLSPMPALGLVLAGLVALFGLGGWLFGSNIAEQMTQLIQRLPELGEEIRLRFARYDWIVESLGPQQLLGENGAVLGTGIEVVSTTFGVVAYFVIVVFMGIFLAVQPSLYIRGLVLLVPAEKRRRAREIIRAIGRTLQWWLVGQLVLMLAVGTLSGIGLWFLDVPLALALGVLAGVLNFIPYLGPIFAAVPALLVALSVDTVLAGYVLLLYVGIQSIEGYVLEPVVQQRVVYLAPALILFSQLILGILLGTLGVMLATPLAAAGMVAIKMVYVEGLLGTDLEAPS